MQANSFVSGRGAAGRRIVIAAVAIGLAVTAPLGPALAEMRCGWLENPTPGNWWLKDSRGLWIISAQGGPYAEGVDKLPQPSPDRFVATNGQYGYMCACVSGTFDPAAQTVTRIEAARASALSACRDDKTLPTP
jgi:uncharacterized protein DUF4087